MPKVIVSGRGGSGKITLVALLARELQREAPILVLDADESNLGLSAMLGMRPPEKSLLDSLGGKPSVMEKMRALFQSNFREKIGFFEGNLDIQGLPKEVISVNGHLTLVQVGKIQHSMEGCACPMGVVARDFLNHLNLGEGQWVLVDTDAGVEHFGRGLLEGTDMVLIVTDPSREAVVLAKKAASMATEAGKPFWIVLNKVEAETEPLLRELLAREGLEELAVLSYSSQVVQSNLTGSPLSSEELRVELERIIAFLEGWWKGSGGVTLDPRE